VVAASSDDPRAILQHIETLCGTHAALFDAMLAVVVMYPEVPRPLMASAIKQFRRDTDTLTQEDVMGLQTSLINGARQAFEAVLRTRRGGERKAAALPFLRPD
jgi:hypothetical protein